MSPQQIQDSIIQEQIDRHAGKNVIIERLETENAALKAELKAINATLDDPRTDLTMTACEVIASLKGKLTEQAKEIEWLHRYVETAITLNEPEYKQLHQQLAESQAREGKLREVLKAAKSLLPYSTINWSEWS